jgi:asparagine synthase (glutamine-hydrolysing)
MRVALRDVTAPACQVVHDHQHRWIVGRAGAAPVAKTEPSQPLAMAVGSVRAARDESIRAVGCDLVVERYATAGTQVGGELQGAFAALVIDIGRSRLLLINDTVGTFPLYWHHRRSHFLFATSLGAVVAALPSTPTLDPRAAADYVHYGFVLGAKTLASEVQLVPPGCTLVYSWQEDAVTLVHNRRPSSLFAELFTDRAVYLEEVRGRFNESVERASGAEALGVSLSGGLDSRAVLSAVRGKPARTYTVGVKGCADEVIADTLSRIAGTQHHFVELGRQYLRDFLPNTERMIALTDGMYLSHGLTEMLALTAVRESGIRTLLRGHCGELAKTRLAWPLHTDSTVMGMRDRTSFADYYFARVNYVSRDIQPGALFSRSYRSEVAAAARASLDEALDEAPGLSPANLCSYLYLTQLHRRFTIPSIELFRREVDVRMPFADEGFLRALFSGPPEWREGTDIHRYITGRNNARLLRVRNSNTGAPGSAGPFLERILDPVNSVLKRLNAPGYRHYHDFDGWMRTQLLASVEEVLLDGTTARRDVYDMAAVRQLLDQTRSGRADRAYLLQVLLVMELWQRQLQLAPSA